MPFGAASPTFALPAPPRTGVLTARRAWLAGCVLCAGGVSVLLAPDQVDRADILVSGAAAPQAMLSLAAILRAADPDLGVVPSAGSLALSLRHASLSMGFAASATPHAMAAAAIMALPPQAPVPNPAPDDALLTAEREEAEAALSRTEADLARLSAALTDMARDQAQLLQQDGAPTPDPDNAPTRKLLADLQARRIDLAARYTTDFPGIAITDQEITQLQALIATPARAGMAAALAAHAGALAVLRAEQSRVGGELAAAGARRNAVMGRIHDLEQSLAVSPQARPAPLSLVVIDLPGETMPDQRPLPLGGVAALGVLGLLVARPRRRVGTAIAPLTSEIAALEAAIGLKVITCLDAHGARLPAATLAAPRLVYAEGGGGSIASSSARARTAAGRSLIRSQ